MIYLLKIYNVQNTAKSYAKYYMLHTVTALVFNNNLFKWTVLNFMRGAIKMCSWLAFEWVTYLYTKLVYIWYTVNVSWSNNSIINRVQKILWFFKPEWTHEKRLSAVRLKIMCYPKTQLYTNVCIFYTLYNIHYTEVQECNLFAHRSEKPNIK